MEVKSIYKVERKKSNIERYRELNEQEKVFCTSILKGRTNVQAMADAGYCNDEELADSERKAYIKGMAYTLLKKPAIIDYINSHKQTITIVEDRDDELLAFHIYEIAMGRCVRETRDAKGKKITETPSFGDQIAAGSLYLKIREQEKKDKLLNNIKQANKVAEIQSNKVKSLLDQFKFDKPLTLTQDISADFIDLPLTDSAKIQQERISKVLNEKVEEQAKAEEIKKKEIEAIKNRQKELKEIVENEENSIDERMDAEYTLLQHSIVEKPLTERKPSHSDSKNYRYKLVPKEVK